MHKFSSYCLLMGLHLSPVHLPDAQYTGAMDERVIYLHGAASMMVLPIDHPPIKHPS